MTIINPITFAQELIRCPSVTPEEGGALDLLQTTLESLGFRVWRQVFEEEGTAPVDNLYARLGTAKPNLCFAGHTDVVPVGDESAWTYPPFAAEIRDGVLHGRGAEDMKAAIAAFVAAVSQVLEAQGEPNGSISLLITGDEEGPGINGTKKMLKWLAGEGEKLDACIVGEPTNPTYIGEMVKIGRRGSINATITVQGVQGHVAYPHLADNPIEPLVEILHRLQNHVLDEGTEFFPPSNLEITTVDVKNAAENVIPARATARVNIRFNDIHSGTKLQHWITSTVLEVAGDKAVINFRVSGEAFLTKPGELSDTVVRAVEEITGNTPELSTTGGTSDARFIKDYCPVVEFGTTGKTPHKVNECVAVKDVEMLSDVYEHVIRSVVGD